MVGKLVCPGNRKNVEKHTVHNAYTIQYLKKEKFTTNHT